MYIESYPYDKYRYYLYCTVFYKSRFLFVIIILIKKVVVIFSYKPEAKKVKNVNTLSHCFRKDKIQGPLRI